MNNLIKEASKAKKLIADKKCAMISEIEMLDKKYSEVEDFYYKEIRKLESEKYEKILAIEQQKQLLRDIQSSFFEKMNEPIIQFEKVLLLIDHTKRENEKDLTLEPYSRYGTVEEVSTLIDNEYLNLRVFIYNNKKPKNKYTICIAGKSFFWNRELTKYPYSYSCRLDWPSISPSILIELKDASSVEELILWWEKNKKRSFWNEKEHNELVNLYKWTLENCNTYEWELEYLLYKKRYYEERVYRGTEKPEYEEILKALNELEKRKLSSV